MLLNKYVILCEVYPSTGTNNHNHNINALISGFALAAFTKHIVSVLENIFRYNIVCFSMKLIVVV